MTFTSEKLRPVDQIASEIEELEQRKADYSTASIEAQIAAKQKALRNAALAERSEQDVAERAYRNLIPEVEAATQALIEVAHTYVAAANRLLDAREAAKAAQRTARRLGVQVEPMPLPIANQATRDRALRDLLYDLRKAAGSML